MAPSVDQHTAVSKVPVSRAAVTSVQSGESMVALMPTSARFCTMIRATLSQSDDVEPTWIVRASGLPSRPWRLESAPIL